MADGTAIEWARHPETGKGATWNPVTGCSVVSPGCTNCYAMKLAGTRLRRHESRKGLTRDTKAGPVWTGEVRLNEQWLDQPLRWRAPRGVFVCAHGDLFAEGVPDAWIDRVFAVMALAPQHVFFVLTKRPDRMRAYLATPAQGAWAGRAITIDDDGTSHPTPDVVMRLRGGVLSDTLATAPAAALNHAAEWQDRHYPEGDGFMRHWPLPNVWLGVSIEDQRHADERVPLLLDTPAARRFVSAEPLLGPIDLTNISFPNDRGSMEEWDALSLHLPEGVAPPDGAEGATLDWIIAGGESGPNARPMHPDWVRALRDQCDPTDAAFFFKQWGEWGPDTGPLAVGGDDPIALGRYRCAWRANGQWHFADDYRSAPVGCDGGAWMFRVGKKAAGRLLDGREWNEMPEIVR